MRRGLGTAVGLVVFGVPMVLVSLWALGMQDRAETALGGARTLPGSIANAGRAVNDWVTEARDGQIASALFDPVMITDLRYVAFERAGLTLDDVLAPGETPPAPEYAHLWITARGLALAQAEGCPALLDTIATRCSAGRLDVDPRDDGTFRLAARLGYAPADAPGRLPPQGRGAEVRDLRLRLPESGGVPVPDGDATAVERQLLLAAQAACRDLRAETGTCVIRTLRFERRARGGEDQMSAVVTLSSLAVEGPGQEASLTGPDPVQDAAASGDGRSEVAAAASAGGILGLLRGVLGGGGAQARSGSGEAPRVLQGGAARNTRNTIAVGR